MRSTYLVKQEFCSKTNVLWNQQEWIPSPSPTLVLGSGVGYQPTAPVHAAPPAHALHSTRLPWLCFRALADPALSWRQGLDRLCRHWLPVTATPVMEVWTPGLGNCNRCLGDTEQVLKMGDDYCSQSECGEHFTGNDFFFFNGTPLTTSVSYFLSTVSTATPVRDLRCLVDVSASYAL